MSKRLFRKQMIEGFLCQWICFAAVLYFDNVGNVAFMTFTVILQMLAFANTVGAYLDHADSEGREKR